MSLRSLLDAEPGSTPALQAQTHTTNNVDVIHHVPSIQEALEVQKLQAAAEMLLLERPVTVIRHHRHLGSEHRATTSSRAIRGSGKS